MSEEQPVWEGRPSQVINFSAFLVCAVTSPLIVPIFIAFWKWLKVRCMRYELTTERLRMTTGVLSRRMDEVELYRIKDTRYEQPFWLRLFGLANIVLQSSDRLDALVVLNAIPNARDVQEKVRANVEKMRDRKRVREID